MEAVVKPAVGPWYKELRLVGSPGYKPWRAPLGPGRMASGAAREHRLASDPDCHQTQTSRRTDGRTRTDVSRPQTHQGTR
ncbi:hypothetical protein L249_6916, partial [Ophiocordyceps polyrhachis-furcata BCC 54312]